MIRRMITTIWLLFIVTLTRFFFLLHNACTICILTPIEVIVACLRPLCPPSVFRDWETAKDDDCLELADRVEKRSDGGVTHDECANECVCSTCVQTRLYQEHRSVSQDISGKYLVSIISFLTVLTQQAVGPELAKYQLSLPVRIVTLKPDDTSDANSPSGSIVSSASSSNMSRLRNYFRPNGTVTVRNRSHEKLHETDLRRRLYKLQKSNPTETSDTIVVSKDTLACRTVSSPVGLDTTVQSSALSPNVGTRPHSREDSKNASYESVVCEENRAPARPSSPSSSGTSSYSRLMRIFQFQRTKVRLTEQHIARYRSRISDVPRVPTQTQGLSAAILSYRLNAVLRDSSDDSLALARIDEQSPNRSLADSTGSSPDSSGRRQIRDRFRKRLRSKRRAALTTS
ncbi:hypothetical protein V1525DRAFT_402699 [Lipomyces kononenkoae]|uniref:Uncharacterized protein n=1 Tax=Lipomyces kononenkoae TaxID=34357 RepID=A0ACC3T2M7_LIPKO